MAEASTRASQLKEILRQTGPCLSSEIVQRLAAKGTSPVNARKIVQRGGAGISTLKALKFPHNERFVYLSEDFGSELFVSALIRDLKAQNTSYGSALSGLEAHGNVVEEKRFHVISGSPLRLKDHLGSDRILDNLTQVALLAKVLVRNEKFIVLSTESGPNSTSIQEAKSRGVAEQVAFSAIRDWARKMGLISYKKGTFRTGEVDPQFGQFSWDFTAPSYLRALTEFKDGVLLPGFLVADVVLGRQLTREQVDYFIRKTNVINELRKHPINPLRRIRPFIAMLVGDGFNPEALRAGRRSGLVFTTPSLLFGEAVGTALRLLVQTLTNAAVVAKNNPDQISELFDKLAVLESAAASLRGPLFEMIVAHAAVISSGGWVQVGKIVTDPTTGRTAEIDVLQTRNDLIRVFECKGHLSATRVSLEVVQNWVNRRIPVIRRYLNKYHPNVPLQFELWTTGHLDREAKNFLDTHSDNETRYSLRSIDVAGVLKELRKIKANRLVDVINEHYVKAPLNKLHLEVAESESLQEVSAEQAVLSLEEAKRSFRL